MKAEKVATREINIAVAITIALFSAVIIGIAFSSWVWKADFAVPYTGGVIVRQGHGPILYDLAEQEHVQEALLMRRGLLLDMYPPYHALLFAPLTRLGYRAAYLVWGFINILLWVMFRYLLREEGSRMQPFRFLIVSALFFPLWVAFVQGQLSILLLVSFALAFVCMKDNRDWAAGLSLGLGLLKFQVVLPFALIFVLRRRWRFIGGLAIAAAFLALLSLIAVGPAGLASYLRLLVDTFRHPHTWAYVPVKPSNMPTIRGFVLGVFTGVLPPFGLATISAAVSGCLVLATAWIWQRQDSDISFDLMFAAAVVVSLLTAPYLYPHDLAPLILATTLVMASPEWNVRSRKRSLLLFVIAVLYASPLYLAPLLGREQLYVLATPIVIFAVVVLFLAREGTSKRNGTPEHGPDRTSVAPSKSFVMTGLSQLKPTPGTARST